jgi:polysaccharide deacetylase 2 family uncharacterized protein YibQ
VESDGALCGILNTLPTKTSNALAILCCAFVLLSLAGCKRDKPARLTPTQIHQIAQELAKAAADEAPQGSLIKSRRARPRSGASGGEELYVGLRSASVPSERIQQALAGIAAAHGLTVSHEVAGTSIARMIFRSRGVVTHRIEIEQLPGTTERSLASPGQARLAILMDDLGSDRTAAETIFALRVPVTISVLPFHPYSQEIAREARQRGCEVMLHLPMQSLAGESPEQQELHPGLSTDEIRRTVEKMLDAVPEADGVNNHQGSQATADAPLMNQLMRVLKDEGVFYVDSRTTAATVAFDAAKREVVRSSFRNVPFLDDIQNKDAVRRQLRLAIQGAKQKGEAIAIGHPHAETLAALREMLPQAKREGVQLVFVSELVH